MVTPKELLSATMVFGISEVTKLSRLNQIGEIGSSSLFFRTKTTGIWFFSVQSRQEMKVSTGIFHLVSESGDVSPKRMSSVGLQSVIGAHSRMKKTSSFSSGFLSIPVYPNLHRRHPCLPSAVSPYTSQLSDWYSPSMSRVLQLKLPCRAMMSS